MLTAELKPILAALLLPPAGPLLLALAGLFLAAGRRRLAGTVLVLAGLMLLWFFSCNAVAGGLAQWLLPAVRPLSLRELQAADVQAIVVLGGGVLPQAPEYGQAQPSANTLARLRYGVRLARQSGKPMAFAGGVGWSAIGSGAAAEGEVARRVVSEDYGLALRWVDDRSRDTAENAQRLQALMQRDGVLRIALVTDAWHMPRAAIEFKTVGFDVTDAPTGFAGARERTVLEWLPSAHGLSGSRQVLREWLALQIARF